MQISRERFKDLLPAICNLETSSDPNNWTQENPLWGHCAVVSLVAQNLFGGKLARASLEDTEFAEMVSHYWNIFPDGTGEDFTAPQFQGKKPVLTASERTRDYVLYDPKTGKPREIMNRYKLLAVRLVRMLNSSNPLFNNPIYQTCLFEALGSPCQKMWFGCVIRYQSSIVYRGCNKTLEPLKSMCDPLCIRLNIQSRTESTIGACGHAEELGISECVKIGIPLKESSLYVAGLYSTGLPYIKKEADFTCLLCARQLYNYGIGQIYIPVVDKWVGISAEQAVETARAYAMKEKTV